MNNSLKETVYPEQNFSGSRPMSWIGHDSPERRAPYKGINLIKKRFHRLLVISRGDRNKHGRMLWNCQCDCGEVATATTQDLQRGHTKSCGCLWFEGPNRIHGMTHTTTYKAWQYIHRKCRKIDGPIKVCKRWDNFLIYLFFQEKKILLVFLPCH